MIFTFLHRKSKLDFTFNPDPAVVRKRQVINTQNSQKELLQKYAAPFRPQENKVSLTQDKPPEYKAIEEYAHQEWLLGFHADCIHVPGRPDLAVLIVSREGQVTHTEVVGGHIEDMDPMPPSPLELPRMPYKRSRTYIEDTERTKQVGGLDLNVTQEALRRVLPGAPLKQSQVMAPTEASGEVE